MIDPIDPVDPRDGIGTGPPDVRSVGFAGAHGVPSGTRWRRRLAAALGALLALVGLVGFGWGLWTTSSAGRAIDDDAVARTSAGPPGAEGEAATFVAPARQEYTIWLDNGGASDEQRDAIVASVACVVRTADGAVAEVRGARQGSSVTLGSRSTVGTFRSSEGRVEVACTQQRSGSPRAVLVVPGGPEAAGLAIGATVAGVFAMVGGILLLGVLRRSR
ncbi:MAG: hypothetical protein KDA97_06200 [Acidimicrobiales bacterium]|nr:hypothetical protein [Acidimicrobiales bacterium]